jgi:hypothetical protein
VALVVPVVAVGTERQRSVARHCLALASTAVGQRAALLLLVVVVVVAQLL